MALLRINSVAAALALTWSISFLSTASAYSTGAGGCAGGMPAVGGLHIASTYKNGTLAQGGFQVLLDGKALNPGVAALVSVGQKHTLTLQSIDGCKGLLFRLGGVGLGALSPTQGDSLLQVAGICVVEPASGVTHTSNVVKRQSNLYLKLVAAGLNLPLDVTVVVSNSVTSEFYYSPFLLNAAAVTQTASPVKQTPVPVAPTPVPVAPTLVPVAPFLTRLTPTSAPFSLVPAPIVPTPTLVMITPAPISPTASQLSRLFRM